MGFGYEEKGDFGYALIKKFGLKPEVVIMDSYPYFQSGSSLATWLTDGSANSIKGRLTRLSTWWDYQTKKAFNTIHPKICDWSKWICRLRAITIWRDEKDGFWIWRNLYTSPEQNSLPIEPSRRATLAPPDAAELRNANRIIDETGARRDCVILTAITNSVQESEPYAREAGRRLGVQVDVPKVDGLVTIDHAHLTWSSAQRWSKRFLEEVAPIIESCVSKPPG